MLFLVVFHTSFFFSFVVWSLKNKVESVTCKYIKINSYKWCFLFDRDVIKHERICLYSIQLNYFSTICFMGQDQDVPGTKQYKIEPAINCILEMSTIKKAPQNCNIKPFFDPPTNYTIPLFHRTAKKAFGNSSFIFRSNVKAPSSILLRCIPP